MSGGGDASAAGSLSGAQDAGRSDQPMVCGPNRQLYSEWLLDPALPLYASCQQPAAITAFVGLARVQAYAWGSGQNRPGVGCSCRSPS